MFHLILRVLFLRAQPIAINICADSRLAFLHLYFLMQLFWNFQEIRFRKNLHAPRKVVQTDAYMSLVLIQSQTVGDANCSRNQGLNPDFLVRVYCSSDMLLHGYTSWLDQLNIALRCKRFAVCLADIVCDACSVVKQDDKTIDCEHGISINMIQWQYQ